MKVLIACEFSGTVREAFAARGHDAWSCDLLPSEREGQHLQCDVREILLEGWDLMIAHPPCTYLCSSGLHWNKRRPERAQQTEDALAFVDMLWKAPVPLIVIENPQGCINTRLPDMPRPQVIQPYQFGENASKTTCLWLRGVPPLRPTKRIVGRWALQNGQYVERWDNQTDSGQNRLGPSEDRWAERSKTYPGIAEAMADQWGRLLEMWVAA